jgi:hypothetical protein
MMMCIEYWVHVLEFPSSAAAMLERPNGSHYRMSKYPNDPAVRNCAALLPI